MDLKDLVEGWKRRIAEEAREADARERALRARLPAAVRALVERHGARRVVLFGSLAEGRAHGRSDIDLAAEGIAPERYLAACVDVEEAIGRDVRTDLIRIERAKGLLRDDIDAGEVLYESR